MKIKDLINKLNEYDDDLDILIEIETDFGEYQDLNIVDSDEFAISGTTLYVQVASLNNKEDSK